MKTYSKIEQARFESILANLSKAKVGIIGDFCLDIYWHADMKRSELSRETPHFPLPVVEERMSPGGGGNVVANMAALSPGTLIPIGVIGNDWRGSALESCFNSIGVDSSYVVRSKKFITNAYCKPMRKGISEVEYEDPRIDFTNYTTLPEEDEKSLIAILDQVIPQVDILCVSDQMGFGCVTPAVRERILSYAKQGAKIMVDSRDRIALYSNVILKPNELEAYKAVTGKLGVDIPFDEQVSCGKQLAVQNSSNVCMTIGSKGNVICKPNEEPIHIETYPVEGPIDICGAGDTFLSAFACASAAGAIECEAAFIANLASSITIKKINTTGTATREELIDRYKAIFG